MSFLKNGFIIALFALLGLGVAGWVSTDYWWNTRIKPSPEYQLVAVAEAFQQCNKTQLNKAIDLHSVLYNIGEQQVTAELKKRTALTRHLVNSALVAPFIRKKIQTTVTTLEQDMMRCSTNSNTATTAERVPFWITPSMQSLAVFKSIFNIVSIDEIHIDEQQHKASFVLRFISSKPKELNAIIQLKKLEHTNASWQISQVHLSDELIGLLSSFNAKTEKKGSRASVV